MFDLFKKKNMNDKIEVEDETPSIIASYSLIRKIRSQSSGTIYNLPIIIWIDRDSEDEGRKHTNLADNIFAQLGKFYGWKEMLPGSIIVSSDNEYIGVKAFDKFYKLPERIKATTNNDVITDVLLGLAKIYKWEEVTKKDDTE